MDRAVKADPALRLHREVAAEKAKEPVVSCSNDIA